MKIRPTDYADLRDALRAVLQRDNLTIARLSWAAQELEIPDEGIGWSLWRRLSNDTRHALTQRLYAYMNDACLTTALRHLVAELRQGEREAAQ